jgi:hypothetical protein
MRNGDYYASKQHIQDRIRVSHYDKDFFTKATDMCLYR